MNGASSGNCNFATARQVRNDYRLLRERLILSFQGDVVNDLP